MLFSGDNSGLEYVYGTGQWFLQVQRTLNLMMRVNTLSGTINPYSVVPLGILEGAKRLIDIQKSNQFYYFLDRFSLEKQCELFDREPEFARAEDLLNLALKGTGFNLRLAQECNPRILEVLYKELVKKENHSLHSELFLNSTPKGFLEEIISEFGGVTGIEPQNDETINAYLKLREKGYKHFDLVC